MLIYWPCTFLLQWRVSSVPYQIQKWVSFVWGHRMWLRGRVLGPWVWSPALPIHKNSIPFEFKNWPVFQCWNEDYLGTIFYVQMDTCLASFFFFSRLWFVSYFHRHLSKIRSDFFESRFPFLLLPRPLLFVSRLKSLSKFLGQKSLPYVLASGL